MATTLRALGIDRLSVDDRITLVQQIWDSIAADAEQRPLTDAQRQELERRADDDDANLDDVIPWDQVKAEAMLKFLIEHTPLHPAAVKGPKRPPFVLQDD